jgi:nitroimidazol reductase NimA-like FMN-containing flavoprotein (pyridoxamine 5'-phosphate oxidase superfamily)
MHETKDDLQRLQALLDRSYQAAGSHLLSIHTHERRLTAGELSEMLTGVCVLALATVTASGDPLVAPVDGLFYRGTFWFGSACQSVRFRHIRRHPRVSAAHLRGEELSVTVHGTASEVAIDDEPGFLDYLVSVYAPRHGGDPAEWSEWARQNPYARIDPEKMFTFFLPSDH